MANIIIPGHEKRPDAVPDILRYGPSRPFNRQGPAVDMRHDTPTHTGDYDQEFENPYLKDPRIAQRVEEFERRVVSKSDNFTTENALREYERNYNDHRTVAQRWIGQERWQGRENEEMRLVRIMHPHTFMAKFARAGVDARIDAPIEGIFSTARLWLNEFSRVGRVGVNTWMPNKERGHGRIAQTICTLQYPYAPEYSIMRFNEYNVPTNERYHGWRTTLLTLIMTGVVTEEEAERAFGPALGIAGEFYREQLYLHRAITLGVRTQ